MATRNKLTDTQIKALKKSVKAYSVADGQGLVIDVRPTGVKVWRLRYRFNNKPVLLTLGEYPYLTIKQAREQRDHALELLANGIDPREEKEEAKALAIEEEQAKERNAFTFGQAFDEWFRFKSISWSVNYADDVAGRARMYLLPKLGAKPLATIKTTDCIECLKYIETIGRYGALDKVKVILTSLFKYFVSMGKLEHSPMTNLDNSIFIKSDKKNFEHLTTPQEIIETYQKLARPYKGYDVVHDGALTIALTFLRASEVASMKWDYVDWEKHLIRIPAQSMKMKREHLVPISTQVKAILERRQAQRFNDSDYVFASPNDFMKPINPESMRKVLRLQGIDKDVITSHGWRHSASTWLHEQGFEHFAIEAQLSHIKSGVHGKYDKSEYLTERTKMMQTWADFLTG